MGSCIHWVGQGNCALFGEDVVKHLYKDREILAFIIGGEDDGVLVL